MRAIIIGNSATAVGAVESMRLYDQSAEILVISKESDMIYSRPLLSHYLAGQIGRQRVAYRDPDFYVRYDVGIMTHDEVTAIDTAAHLVRTASGQALSYDKLLISTGGRPIVPPMPGLDAQGIYTFTELGDAEGILKHIEQRQVGHAVVVGGGMIGIKAVAALQQRGVAVTMLELAPRILIAAFDQTGSDMVTEILQEGGVTVLTGTTVAQVQTSDGAISAVTLTSGETLPCDLMVFGIGVRPNGVLAKEAGIAVNRGIVVDEFMRTSAPDVYAAGDVAEAYDLVVDMNRTVAIWPNAYRQGAIAGAHMVGVERPDKGGVAMNTIEACGVAAMAIGSANVEDDGQGTYQFLADLDVRQRRYRRLVIQDGRLIGALLVGDINRAGIYTGLIRAKTLVEDCSKALLSPHLSLLSLPDVYRKHVVKGEGIEI
jgi:NAD(P)H-nitrite reductase large subunit